MASGWIRDFDRGAKKETPCPPPPTPMASDSTYAIMLTGAGPLRAHAERVSHVIYLARQRGNTVQVMPFDSLPVLLKSRGVHCTEHSGTASIHVPFLPRNFVSGVSNGVFFPLSSAEEEDARRDLLAWCKTHATCSKSE